MENKEKLKAKARRLKALADRGVGGEKENAKRIYKEFIEKHKIEESEIDPSLNNRKFRVNNYDDSLILTNVILSVNPYTKITAHELCIQCDLDEEDFNEVKQKFRYFVKLYRIEKELLNMAFFSKHQKFFVPDEHSQNKWRESKKENDELRKARERAENITKKAEDKPAKLNPEQIEKIKKENQIQMMNLSRLTKMSEILMEGKYVRNNKTIESKNN